MWTLLVRLLRLVSMSQYLAQYRSVGESRASPAIFPFQPFGFQFVSDQPIIFPIVISSFSPSRALFRLLETCHFQQLLYFLELLHCLVFFRIYHKFFGTLYILLMFVMNGYILCGMRYWVFFRFLLYLTTTRKLVPSYLHEFLLSMIVRYLWFLF